MLKEKRQIVMLPTDKALEGCIGKYYSEDGRLMLMQRHLNGNKIFDVGISANSSEYLPQHLYILSNEEIKANDWFIWNNKLFQAEWVGVSSNTHLGGGRPIIYYKNSNRAGNIDKAPYSVDFIRVDCGLINGKVIASTDKLLEVKEILNNERGRIAQMLPTMRESVIKAYIEDYNNDKQWKFVNVEYEDVLLEKDATNGKFSTIRLKLRDDNTVIISPIKETFTRDEVLDVIRKYATTYYEGNLGQWFNENY